LNNVFQIPLSKPQRKKWNCDGMALAISAASKEKDAKHRSVPRSTLQIYVNSISLHREESVVATLGRKTVLHLEIEDSLFSYRIDMDARHLGLSAADVRRLVCQP
jgi:hypothetical protein